MIRIIKRFVSYFSLRTGRGRSLYKRLCAPNAFEWATYLAAWGGLHSVRRKVRINLGCNIADPALVRIGNNVTLADCALQEHDGGIRILNTRFNKKLDSVGAIDVLGNCFIRGGSIVMSRVTIGPDTIVAAGAVVTKDALPGVVVGGNPARIIYTTEELVQKMEARCNTYPWIDIIRQGSCTYDPQLEPTLTAMRVRHYFGEQPNA